MRVALFGSTGYLGSQIAHDFRQRGVDVAALSHAEHDITDPEAWAVFDPSGYDAVLFFAGVTGTERSFADPGHFCAANELGLLGLLSRVAQFGEGAPKVVFPSSRLVYRGSWSALREDDPKEARTVYAANKLACEFALQAYNARYGVPYVVMRICVPYGSLVPREYSYGTVGSFVRQADSGDPITLYGDGGAMRTFTHVRDIAEAAYRLASSEDVGVFNVGGSVYRLRDVAGIVAGTRGVGLRFVPWPDSALRIESGSTFFDGGKLARTVGEIGYADIAGYFRSEEPEQHRSYCRDIHYGGCRNMECAESLDIKEDIT